MDFHAVDAKLFALIVAATVATVFVLKKLFPKLVNDREEVFAVILPVLFVVIAKALHAFTGTNWVDALLWALASGGAAGVAHDYGAKPLVQLFTKRVDAGPNEKEPRTSGEPTPPDSTGGAK